MQPHQHLVIIGNGIAGITLAQQVRKKSNCPITLISAESPFHFSRPALMYVYMGHMRYQDIIPFADWYYQEQQLNMIQGKVIYIDFEKKSLKLDIGEQVSYDVLVLATGSRPTFINWPGVESTGVQGLVTLQDLELMQQQTQNTSQAVVVGGGLIGIEMAEMLRSRGIDVTMLVRDQLFWKSNLPTEEATLVTNHIRNHGINLLLQEELQEIVSDENTSVKAVKTRSGKTIPCQFVGIAIGVNPNIEFLKTTDLETDKGVLVNDNFNTNIPDVYAIGDCAQFLSVAAGQPVIEQLWYTARLHGEALAYNLTETPKPYSRGPWFNSAKFLDLEYQTYGVVPAVPDPSVYSSFYWEHPDKLRAIRILYETKSEKFCGINLLGVRYRHDLCHYWLENNFSIHTVMQELKAANFDTEFFERFEPELMRQYELRFPDQKSLKEKLGWWQIRERYRLYNSTSKLTDSHHE